MLRLSIHIADNDAQVPSRAWTDGEGIYFRAEFLDEINDDELSGVIIHEALHTGFLHHTRLGGKDPEKWNAACDYAINSIVFEDGLVLPDDHLHNSKYKGLSAEEIYNLLPDGEEGQGWGAVIPGNPETEEECREALIEAMHAAILAGRLKGTAERLINEVLPKDRVNWLDYLSSSVARVVGQSDYSYKRLSRRAVALDYIAPGLIGEQCGPVAFCVDSSGSVSNDDINDYIAVIRSCINQVRPLSSVIIVADTEIHDVIELSEYDDVSIPHVGGGGGTSFVDAISRAAQYDPCAIVYFTDLYGDFGAKPNCPVFWAVNERSDVKPPFGELINIGENDER